MFPLAAALTAHLLAVLPNGYYAIGELGVVELTTVDNKVTGRLKTGGRCPLPANSTLLSGAWEGNTFTGTVLVCQEGSSCGANQLYPWLAVADDSTARLSGHLRFAPGCRSPAVKANPLVMRPATPEEAQRAARRLSKTEAAQYSAEAILSANVMLELQNYEAARDKFAEAIELDDSRWEGLLGVGIAEFRLGHAELALPWYEKAQLVAESRKLPRSRVAQVHYNRACALAALKRNAEAIDALRAAVKLGGAADFIEQIEHDIDLEPLRPDPAFRRFSGEVQIQLRKKR